MPTPRRGLWKWTKHVVNTAMATKAAALSWRLDQRPADRAFATRMLEILDRHHGQVTGVFSGDECLAGRSPLQGTELCAVVELMYSLEHLFSVFGDASFGDRLERVAFNALPATFAPDMWSHQYDQQVNQVQCTVNPEHLFTTNGPESNLYGLEPNFGCCTANMHQGWPKLVAHLWMKTRDEGLVAAAWAPQRGLLHLARRAGRRPGRHRLPLPRDARDHRPPRAGRALSPRPARAGVGGGRDGEPGRRRRAADEGRVAPPPRAGVDRRDARSSCDSPCDRRSRRRYNEAVAVERGPLVYALAIGEEWTRIHADKPHRELPHGDFEVRPTTPWNYGLRARPRAARGVAALRGAARRRATVLAGGRGDERHGARRGGCPAGSSRTAGRARSRAPTRRGRTRPRGSRTAPLEEVRLVPYGCTNIRITEFPKVE